MKLRIVAFILFIFNTFLFSQENFNVPVTPSNDQELDRAAGYARTLSEFDGSINAYTKLKAYINVLDSKGMNQLKKHPSYPILGDVYMYGASYLSKDLKEDKIIELYKKALELRADPNSNYRLATIYKKKFDDAVKKNDKEKEKEYGKNVYNYLNSYLALSGNKSSKYKEILSYFSSYK